MQKWNSKYAIGKFFQNVLTADFYLAVFSQDMQSILYGGYYGGNQSREHVDGGTSDLIKW